MSRSQINPIQLQLKTGSELFLYNSGDTLLNYELSTLSPELPCNPGSKPTGDKTGTAVYHTHGANDPGYLNEEFSPADRNYASNNDADIYLGTPGGTIKKYDPSTGQETILRSPESNQNK